ncbi:MAG TPA: hypothetical protein ENK43_03600 [Planctomycetes bacterium]|nr:hypothetical protein [Planctomycetota bacterium]
MKDAVLILIVLAAGVVLWRPVTEGSFLTDDYQIIRAVNQRVDLSEGWSWRNLGRMSRFYVGPNWKGWDLARPSVPFSFACQLLSTGTRPAPFLWTNVVVHLLNGALLFFLLRTWVPALHPWAVALGTLAAIGSPLNSEPVAWSAARSDLLSTFFGLTGLLVWMRGKRWRWIGLGAVALALTAKESALVYLALLPLLSFTHPETLASSHRRRTRWTAVLAPVLLLAAYLVWRRRLVGGLGEAQYARQSLGDYLTPSELIPRWAISAWRAIAPVSDLHVSWPEPARWIVGALVVTTLVSGWRAASWRVRIPATFLLIAPFLMSTAVNEITPVLLHSRSCYASLAGLAVFTAIALSKGPKWLRGVAVISILAMLPLAYRGAGVFRQASQRVEHTLESFREPLRTEPGRRLGGFVVLGGLHDRYMGDSFGLGGSFTIAMQPPFMEKPLFVVWTSTSEDLAKIAGVPTDGTGFFAVRPSPRGEEGRLVCPGRFAFDPGRRLDRVAPDLGAVLRLDSEALSTAGLPFRWWAVGFDDCRFRLGLVSPQTSLMEVDLPSEAVRSERSPEGTTHSFRIPPAVVKANAPAATGRHALGWYVKAIAPDGRVVGCTGLQLFFLAN